uniref:beta-N-acetylhexosaminidase n=1 Tax=Prevotella sp. GTC17253 TaxID=3236793 RepID=A0AB33IQI1_9BACT
MDNTITYKPKIMFKFSRILFVLLLLVTVSAVRAQLIPQPSSVQWGQGGYTLTSGTTISCDNASLRPAAAYLSKLLATPTGFPFRQKQRKGSIRLMLTNTGISGSYQLSANARGITIKGADYRGVVNGIATLRQLLPTQIESRGVVKRVWTVPAVTITDTPKYSWRGMELDCSRHFFTRDEVMELLDVLALYKINKFHWHLTDDQGWRIEIKKYPLLTQNGAWRTFNNQDTVCINRAREEDNPAMIPAAKNVRSDGKYGGFYTQDDIRAIVSYARDRGIDVIPEIDMPGHSLAAIANYKGLSCFEQTGWGKLFTTPMCPGKDRMLDFCKDIWREVFSLFPSEYVHIGGDEVDHKNWKTCPDCQRRIKDHHLKDEHGLQAWFLHEMEKFINANGRKMIGWDEIIEGGLSATSTVMWWRNWKPTAPQQATAHGNSVILTPNTEFYLDYDEDASSLQKIYGYNMCPRGVTEENSRLILGVQGNLWTEWVPTRERMYFQAFPRMLAVAELGWNGTGKDWDGFNRRVTAHYSRLQQLGVTYRIPELTGFNRVNVFTDEATVKVACQDPSAVIRYTTDGSIPQASSQRYTEPLRIASTTDFAFRLFGVDGRKDNTARFRYVKEDFAPAVSVKDTKVGLQAVWHEYAGPNCTDIEKAPVNTTYTIDEVSIPKEVSGNIGLIITGYIDVPEDGIYTFALLSDDGSWLKIDGQMVVDNDGEHSPREIKGQHAMRKGLHPLEVRFFDHNGGQLRLKVSGGGQVSYRH